jgi:hypothetical protein
MVGDLLRKPSYTYNDSKLDLVSGKRIGFAAWTVQTERDDGPYVNYCGNKNDHCGDYRWIANADSNSDNGFICQK